MKINDLRKNVFKVDVDELECGDWFIYDNELCRVSNYSTSNTMPCICQIDGKQIEFNYGTEVTHVEVEINIIS